jgi:hypothetical protein
MACTRSGCQIDLATGMWRTQIRIVAHHGVLVNDISSLVGEPVPLPIFDDLVGVGVGGDYHIAGFALFVITGYNLGGQFHLNPPCFGDERCVSGYFTTGTVYDGEIGGEYRGIVIVKLTE